jgi:hypothetical protein
MHVSGILNTNPMTEGQMMSDFKWGGKLGRSVVKLHVVPAVQ